MPNKVSSWKVQFYNIFHTSHTAHNLDEDDLVISKLACDLLFQLKREQMLCDIKIYVPD